MPEIKLTNVTKRWGNFYGVDDLNLVMEDNSFITLLGPSGCGKTTTLRMIAGLETPTSGRIEIGDRVVFDSEAGINIPANKRKVGFLFQNYALWPNMTVYQNISFGLSNIKEEMELVDSEALSLKGLIAACKRPGEIVKLVEECKDKDGKTDEKKVYLKFIDSFTLSMYSAKALYGYKIHTAGNPEEAAKDMAARLTGKMDGIIAAYKAKGQDLNDACEVMENGKIKTSVRKLSKEEVDLAVRRVSRIVKIGMFMDRYPAELSGGQQQRVAIARTLAPKPQVLFMDEPLSNLDAKLRLEMRYELQRLHVETGSTFVYVTHDQMEAMTLATKICLINNGVLQQYEAPLKVYGRPNNLFVADFVGNPSINFVEATGRQAADGSIELTAFDGAKINYMPNEKLDLHNWYIERDAALTREAQAEEEKLKVKGAVEKSNKDEVFKYHIAKICEEDYSLKEEAVAKNGDFVVGIRPEFLHLSETGDMEAEIYGAMPTGMESTIKLRVGDYLLTSVVFGNSLFKIGEKTNFSIKGEDILLFDRGSGRLICAGKCSM